MTSYLEQFNYQLTGSEEGTKWVFLHGLMGYAANWRKVTSLLGQGHRILTYDQRGHGRSFKPETGYAPRDFAEDLFLITQELGWDRFNLVGHSMGGRNAISFSHLFSEKLNKLIIEDIGPESDPAAVNYYIRLFDAIPTPFKNKLAAKEFFLNEFPKTSIYEPENPTLGVYLLSNMHDLTDGTIDWRFKKEHILATVKLGRASDQWNDFRQIPVDILVLRGEGSHYFPKEVYQKMLVANPRAKGQVIPHSGHWIHYDQPQLFTTAILNFANN